MVKTISTILILFSSVASVYYSFGGVIKPAAALIYNNANIPHLGIRLLSLLLGAGGLLLLLPQTFKIGGVLLIMHSFITIICYVITKDWKGGLVEFIFLQIPIFLLWAGYPLSILAKFRNLFA